MPNFKFFKRASILFVLAFVLFSNNISLAQERTGRTKNLASIEIKDIKIETTASEIKISGALFNPSSNIVTPEVTNLLILTIIDPLIKPKDEREMLPSLIVAADEGKDYFSLKPNEQRAFSYVLPFSPHIPQANYSLYLGFIRSNGQVEARYEDAVKNLGSSGKEGFLAFDQESCVLLNKEGKKFDNNDGPTFLPGESPETRCLVKNIGDKEIEVSPKILWKEVYVYGKPLDGTLAIETSDQKITFKPGETKLVSLFMPEAEKPQVYQSLVSFEDEDGESRAFNMFFRWTIAGESARVKNVAQISPLKDYYSKGERVVLSVDYFGSADLFWAGSGQNVSNLNNLTIKAVIKDGDGNICGEKEEVLSDIADAGEKNKAVEIVLDKKCKNMSYGVSLSSNQKSLAEESGELPKVIKEKTIANYLYFGALALMFLLAFAFFRKRKIVPIHLLVILFAGAAMFFGAVSTASAAVVTKTYPAEGGVTSTYQWGGDWVGTTEKLNSLGGPEGSKFKVLLVDADFSDYFKGLSDLGEVYADFVANDSSCSNTGMKISIQMSIRATEDDGSLFKQDIIFAKRNSNIWSSEIRFGYNKSSSDVVFKEWDIKGSSLLNLYNSNGTLKSDPRLIIRFRQVSDITSAPFPDQHKNGYFDPVEDGDEKYRDIEDAFNRSDVIRIVVPLKLPAPSVNLSASPSPSTFPDNKTILTWSSTDVSNCVASSSYNNWTSFKSDSGTETISPLWQGRKGFNSNETHTFTLTCERTIGGTTYNYTDSETVTATKSPLRSLTIQKAPGSNPGKVEIHLSDNSGFSAIPSQSLAESVNESSNGGWMANAANYFTGVAEASSRKILTASGKLAFLLTPLTPFNNPYLICDLSTATSCLKDLPEGFYVRLIAEAASASDTELLSCSGGNVCAFQMLSDETVIAQFTPTSVLTPLAVTCSASPNPVSLNTSTTFTATALYGTAPYNYTWSGDNGLSGTTNTATKSYSTTGTKNATIKVTDSSSPVQEKSYSCSVVVSVVSTDDPPIDPPVVPVPGACGTATSYSWDDDGPPTSSLCSSSGGNTTPVKSGSNWTWTCNGSNGGSDSPLCSAGYNYNPAVVNLTLNKTGSGTGNVKLYGWRATPLFSYDWNDYGSTADNDFQDGETAGLGKDWWYKMVATPDSGSYFSSWSGCSSQSQGKCWTDIDGNTFCSTASSGENACFVTMDASKTATVKFDIEGGGGGSNDPIAYIEATENPITDDNTTAINWSSDNATSCQQVDSGLGSGSYKDTGWLTAGNTTSGSYVTKNFITLGGSRTYTINCSNGSKTSPDASVTVTVSNVAGAPSVTMWADPQSVGYKKTSKIKWMASNIAANQCYVLYSGTVDSMNGYMAWYNVPPYTLPFGSGYYKSGIGSNNTTGQATGKLAADTTYKIQCGGYGPSYTKVTAQTTVTVAAPVSDFTFTNDTGAMTATIVEGLSANSSSIDLSLSGEAIGNVSISGAVPFILSGAKAQFSSDGGVTWNDTLSVDISVISQIKVKAINIPGTTAIGTYNVALTAKDVGVGGITKKLNIPLQVKKVSSEWEEF